MPTVLRAQGCRVVIYPSDHRPAHVHVIGADGEAVFVLNCPAGPLSLREVEGLTIQQVRKLARVLDPEIRALCAAWREIHGNH
ncbi:DUF4160 domain-containing protein [Paraburkholderia sp. GAS334]|uniref:DUF4160 domain-containing protein n=1 Tax=Paraburkholderia sp. GAS334 TaxID=3035131 RepID=UPI003D21BEE3